MNNQQIPELLAGKSIQPTPVRMLVLEQFLSGNTAKSLNDLEAALPYSDRSTIFRTLKTFEQKGLLHIIADGSGLQRYARCHADCSDEGHHDVHPHFHCLHCGDTICLKAIALPELGLPSGFSANTIALRIDGSCPACQGNGPEQGGREL